MEKVMGIENVVADATQRRLHSDMRACGIPKHCQDALADYILHHKPVGSFLKNLLSNDLQATFASADDINYKAVGKYVVFLYNVAPGACWGSPEKVKSWLENR